MSSPDEKRAAPTRFAVGRDLAPHVDGSWVDEFVLELRLLGVPGDRIGAALSEVESHCTDSSTGAPDAFGEPVEYARSLDLPILAEPTGLALLGSVGPNLTQVAGMLVLLWSFTAWRRGEPLELTGGQLVALAAALVSMIAVVRWSEPVLRLVVRHPVWLWAAFMGVTVAFLVPAALLDSTVARFDSGLPMALGTAALVGGLVWERARRSLDDPITSPLDAPGTTAPGSGRRSTSLRRVLELAATRALIPVWTVVMLAVVTWFTR